MLEHGRRDRQTTMRRTRSGKPREHTTRQRRPARRDAEYEKPSQPSSELQTQALSRQRRASLHRFPKRVMKRPVRVPQLLGSRHGTAGRALAGDQSRRQAAGADGRPARADGRARLQDVRTVLQSGNVVFTGAQGRASRRSSRPGRSLRLQGRRRPAHDGRAARGRRPRPVQGRGRRPQALLRGLPPRQATRSAASTSEDWSPERLAVNGRSSTPGARTACRAAG